MKFHFVLVLHWLFLAFHLQISLFRLQIEQIFPYLDFHWFILAQIYCLRGLLFYLEDFGSSSSDAPANLPSLDTRSRCALLATLGLAAFLVRPSGSLRSPRDAQIRCALLATLNLDALSS